MLWLNDGLGNLGTVDVATGSVNVIGNSGVVLTDIAFDPLGNLFGIDFDSLYKIDTTTAAVTLVGLVGPITGVLNSLVFASDGTLYGASNQLYSIDTNTGAASAVGPIGFQSAGDLAFLNGNLYLTALTDQLVRVDTATGAGTALGATGVSDLFGLAGPGTGSLFGVSSTSVYTVDPVSGATTFAVSFGGQGLSAANGETFLSEAQTSSPEPSTSLLFTGGFAAVLCLKRKLA